MRALKCAADEPSRGSEAHRGADFEAIAARRARRLTILLVEQRGSGVGSASGYVLETGRVTLVGERETLLADPRVQQAYLGA